MAQPTRLVGLEVAIVVVAIVVVAILGKERTMHFGPYLYMKGLEDEDHEENTTLEADLDSGRTHNLVVVCFVQV